MVFSMFHKLLIIGIMLHGVVPSKIPYTQTKIPLNNSSGVPYSKDDLFYFVPGFDVDENNNFYFLGGDPAILACFKGNKLLFHKKYMEFKANQIFISKDKLYIFDFMFAKNNLFRINKNSATIEHISNKIISEKLNSFLFKDTCLIVELFEDSQQIELSTKTSFAIYDLEGHFVIRGSNPYNIPDKLNPPRTTLYLGVWKDKFVYWDYDLDSRVYKIFLKDSSGKIIESKYIDEKIFGKTFYGEFEITKLRNDKLYVLGRINQNALITEISLKDIFNLDHK